MTGEAFQKILRSEILRSEICFATHDLFLERQRHFQNWVPTSAGEGKSFSANCSFIWEMSQWNISILSTPEATFQIESFTEIAKDWQTRATVQICTKRA